ncbi:ABC transporter ATP-binding protein [Nocardioides euryhalodurans]|nr:ABC transporter ATP-binding protein [Nocardioides euryhalodurans]
MTTTTHPQPETQIECEGLVRIYKRKGVEVVALQGLDLHVRRGELVAIVGASGSGKSTLLNILSGLDSPSAGRALVAGHDLLGMGRSERRHYRLRTCGFVWQRATDNLVPYLDVAQNVDLPQRLAGSHRGERATRTALLLDLLGIADQAGERPADLTGSQAQRLAIAVALANEPQVLFCDEPTGDLDSAESHEVYTALQQVNEAHGTTVVVVTHDPAVAGEVRRTVAIRDGRTASETLRRRSGEGGADHHVLSEEFAVLDRVGRLQLPRDFVTALGMRHRVRVELAEDHIQIWPEEPPS